MHRKPVRPANCPTRSAQVGPEAVSAPSRDVLRRFESGIAIA
jgi:hypothetical protein